LPNTRYYTCDDCKNKFDKWADEIHKKMFIEIFGN